MAGASITPVDGAPAEILPPVVADWRAVPVAVVGVAAAARVIGIPSRTLERWVADGRIASRRAPGTRARIFSKTTLQRFVEGERPR